MSATETVANVKTPSVLGDRKFQWLVFSVALVAVFKQQRRGGGLVYTS